MRRAIELASGRRTHPNPTVGAVVLDRTGTVVGEGWHAGPGTPHAEAVALEAAGARAAGSTVVVTLEPCSHHGRTPPCADALVEAGVARVVVAVVDPDPLVSGTGIIVLTRAGITVDQGVLRAEAEALDPAYFHHRRTGLPRVTVKVAATLDGATAAADGTSRWITGPAARADGHRLRAQADAVVVGAGTVRADNPRLDVRLDDHAGPQPRPVVFAGAGGLPADAALLARDPIVVATRPIAGWPTTVVAGDRYPDPRAALVALAEAGLLEVLVEGGPTLAGALWRAGLVNRGVFHLAATVAGGVGRPMFDGMFRTLGDASPVVVTDLRALGPDVRLEFEVA